MVSLVRWSGDKWLDQFQTVIDEGVTLAAARVANRMARNFGTEGGGVVGIGADGTVNVIARKRDLAKFRRFRQRQRYVSAPPGAYPGVRSGHLRRSVAFVGPDATGQPGVAMAGTNVTYGRHLEFGTLDMPARPWAMRSALEAKGEASAAFTSHVRRGMAAIAPQFPAEGGK